MSALLNEMNRDTFQRVLTSRLTAMHKVNPRGYAFPLDDVPGRAQAMTNALVQGEGEYRTPAVRATMYQLGIRESRIGLLRWFYAPDKPPNNE